MPRLRIAVLVLVTAAHPLLLAWSIWRSYWWMTATFAVWSVLYVQLLQREVAQARAQRDGAAGTAARRAPVVGPGCSRSDGGGRPS